MLSPLVDGAFIFGRFQGDAKLELGAVPAAFLRHLRTLRVLRKV
jgi:hypothetical protein